MEPASSPSGIRKLFDKTLVRPVPSISHISLCPTLDLIAVVTAPTIVEVFRFSGHLAFGAQSHNQSRIKGISWSHDGTSLHMFWDGGFHNELSCSKTGIEPIHVGPGSDDVEGEEATTVSLFPCVYKRQKPVINPVMTDSGESRVEHVHQRYDSGLPGNNHEVEYHRKRQRADAGSLPSILDDINLRSYLPPLDPAPALRDPALWQTIGSWDLSNIQANDRQWQEDKEDGSLILMLRGAQKKSVLNFVLGDLSLQQLLDGHGSIDLDVTHITSQPETCSFALLTLSPLHQTRQFFLLHFEAFAQNGRHLRLVDKSVNTMRHLTRYLIRSIDSLRHYWREGCRSFAAQVANVSEELVASGRRNPDIVAALYQLAMTGQCPQPVKKWIAEDMGAQGITRWFQSLAAALQQIVTVTKENVLPAIEHLSVLAADYRTLSHRRDDFPICEVNDKVLQNVIDDLETLNLVAGSVLSYAESEAHRTYIFSEWLIQTSTILTDPLSNAAKDAEKKIADTDYPELLDFILDSITKNKLNVLLGRSTNQVLKAARRPGNLARRTIELMLKRHEDVSMEPTMAFVELLNLLHAGLYIFDSQEKLYREHIERVRSATRLVPAGPVQMSPNEILTDMTMMRSFDNNDTHLPFTSVIVTVQPEQRSVLLRRFLHSTSATSTPQKPPIQTSYTTNQTDLRLLDAKIIANFLCILLRAKAKGSSLLRLLPLAGIITKDTTTPPLEIRLPPHNEPGAPGITPALFQPQYIIVRKNDNAEHGRMTCGRIALLDKDMKRIRIYDLSLPVQ